VQTDDLRRIPFETPNGGMVECGPQLTGAGQVRGLRDSLAHDKEEDEKEAENAVR